MFDREKQGAYALEVEARDGAPSARPNSNQQPNSGKHFDFLFLVKLSRFQGRSVTRRGFQLYINKFEYQTDWIITQIGVCYFVNFKIVYVNEESLNVPAISLLANFLQWVLRQIALKSLRGALT